MAIENKLEEEFDTVFSRNCSLEPSSHHENEAQARIFKIIVIGDSNVGKTCLTYRFCGGTFLKNPEATIGVDFRERTLELDGESIKSIPEWIDECSRHSVCPMVPRIMVGNKCDLRDRLEVPRSLAQRLADGYNFPLFETSAKDPAEKEHVDAIFLTLAYRLKSHKPLRLKQPSVNSIRQLWEQREQEAGSCQC